MYLEASSGDAGTAAELAASNKVVKYAGLSSQGEFVPIAVESRGPINSDALQFLSKLGSWRLAETTGDVRASSFLFQRISVLVQRILIRFCCTTVLLMVTGQNRVHCHYHTHLCNFCNFWATMGYSPRLKIITNTNGVSKRKIFCVKLISVLRLLRSVT